ncbi:T9SS type A sorting domain-containing protein [candidate division KSB1 bacterium]|nr:T9SS type A sorting domain-containing protein [candidate division KSB1 bacterium]RQW02639.1 MAG: T9SS C-terminal target domain-containing protein [candidate division KSB1 bacterium]
MKSRWLFISLLLLLSATVPAARLEAAAPVPIAHYAFDTGAEDVTGNGFDGTFVGDAYVDDGFLILDGEDDAVETPSIGTFYEMTYAMWVFPMVDLMPLQFAGGINTHDWVAGAVHFKLNYGLLNVGINGYGNDVVGVTLVYPDEWSHIALTVSETEMTLYLNGSFESLGEIAAPQNLVVGDATIGAWNLDREWTGMMDDVRIYDIALTEAEVDSLAKIPPGLSAVSNKEANVPETVHLAQNYPNPFNPITTIDYTLTSADQVRLSVYDLTGEEVAVLVDGIQSAGDHQVRFSGVNLTSGLYFCKLQTADQAITRKMTLVR